MIKQFLLLGLSSLCCFAQGYGYSNLPFLNWPDTAFGWGLTNAPGVILYVNAEGGVTTNSAGAVAGDNQAVSALGDLTGNNHPLLAIGQAGSLSGTYWPTNFTSGGPGNHAHVKMSYDSNGCCGPQFTNTMSAVAYPQPNLFTFVMRDVWSSGGGCVLNGYPTATEQWNYSSGGEHLFAGNNATIANAPPISSGWPQGSNYVIFSVLFDDTNTKVWTNGVRWSIGGTNTFAPGSNGQTGITVGNYANRNSLAGIDIYAVWWASGVYWRDDNAVKYIAQLFSQISGIVIPP